MPLLKNIPKIEIILWFALVLGYLFSRLFNLGIIPIFTDEAIYLRWSQIMVVDATLRYLPLVDGKPPLFMWLVMIVMKLFPALDPLLAGRLVSVGAGLGCLVGIFFATYLLFNNKKAAYLSAVFYLASPFMFFYDRFSLADSLLAMFGIWSLGLGVLLAKTVRLDVAMMLGIVIGLGLLTKTPAQFFLYLLPLLLLVFSRKSDFLKTTGLFLVVVILSQAIFSVLRFFPMFHMINQKNLEFIVPLSYFLKHPAEYFWGNLQNLLQWEFWYLTPFVLLSIFLGIIRNLQNGNWRSTFILVVYFLFPVIVMAAFNKIIYPRYLLPFTPSLLILAAVGLASIKRFNALLLFSVIVFLQPVFTNFKLATDPVHAPLLQADRDQYLDGWAAGYGVIQIREFLKGKRGILVTEGTFGLMPYSLELYQKKEYPDIQIEAYWPLPSTPPPQTRYLVMYQRPAPPPGWRVKEIMSFRQGRGSDYLRLYQVEE